MCNLRDDADLAAVSEHQGCGATWRQTSTRAVGHAIGQSVAAELVALHGGTGLPLSALAIAIHRDVLAGPYFEAQQG